ncbi:MAG: uracil-DNA glycosylase family protein [Syntrophomonadaceae bacterium]|jgi:uracil-DNA glycosylase
MKEQTRQEKIRQIIAMEDRICQCQRCGNLLPCTKRPSMGKGELDPDIILVFEYESIFCRDINNLIELHRLVQNEFNLENIYHTYVVRCQPKACVTRHSVSCFWEKKLIDYDNRCLLTGRYCDAIPVRPGNAEIIACLAFLIEEIETLDPKYIILFGDRVCDYILKSYGIFDAVKPGSCYINKHRIFFATVGEELFNKKHCQSLVNAKNEKISN